jgi:hypothetical protein
MRDRFGVHPRSVAALACVLAVAMLSGCTGNTDAGRSLRPIASDPAVSADVVDPGSSQSTLSGTLIIVLDGTAPHVYNLAVTSDIAKKIDINVNATVTALGANQGGGAGVAEVVHPRTCLNVGICSTWDAIPTFCVPDPRGIAPGANAAATGTYHAEWEGYSADATKSNSASCPHIGGVTGGESPGSGGGDEVCYEAWLVWADGSHPDQFLGVVCFSARTPNAS